jgi:hypothetical protein
MFLEERTTCRTHRELLYREKIGNLALSQEE